MTCNHGQKLSTFLKSLAPICNFHGATTKIKPCYRQKIAFSHYESYRVYCACAVSRDLCIEVPPKPHVTIFDPELPVHYTTFMGLRCRLRIKGLYRSIPMLKRFSAAKSQVKWYQKSRFFRNLENIVTETPKRHFLIRNDVI